MNKAAKIRGRTFVFLGISGSGKGVQTNLLLKALPNSENISTGDGLRTISRKKNLVGRYIRGILHRGDLTPYWAPASIWLSLFISRLAGDENLVLDGAPRLVKEAQMLDDFMRDVGRRPPVAIYLKLGQNEALRRLLTRARSDDNLQAIRGRFKFFKTNVQPVINYYRQRKRLVIVDGGQRVEEVRCGIERALHLK